MHFTMVLNLVYLVISIKKVCFSWFLNAVYDVMVLMLSGRLFQGLGPLTLNDLSGNVFLVVVGTLSNCLLLRL